MNTVSCFYFEQSVVGSALNVALISIEELVFLPFQVDSGVWAAVDEGVKLTVFVDNENIENVTITGVVGRLCCLGLLCLKSRIERYGHSRILY